LETLPDSGDRLFSAKEGMLIAITDCRVHVGNLISQPTELALALTEGTLDIAFRLCIR
jgi:hypothetical protein